MQLTGADSVLHAIRQQGGVYMCGRMVPIWCVVLTEFLLAYLLEVMMGSPASFKLTCRIFDPKEALILNPMRTTERIFFRHIAQKILALRQQAGRFFVQSAEKISRPLAHPDLISASLKNASGDF